MILRLTIIEILFPFLGVGVNLDGILYEAKDFSVTIDEITKEKSAHSFKATLNDGKKVEGYKFHYHLQSNPFF